MNSIDSISSVFDRYSQDYISSAHTTIDFDKPEIFEIKEPTQKTYSQYEPVNMILNTLYSSKSTLLKLNGGKNEISKSYCEFWRIQEENYEVLKMLEPDLISKQNAMFQVYHSITNLSHDLEEAMRHLIPQYAENMELKSKSEVYVAFEIFNIALSTLSFDLKYIIESNIVVNMNAFSHIIQSEFEILERSKEFIKGIANFCNNPSPQLTTLAFKLSMINTLMPPSTLTPELDLARQCTGRITKKIDNERGKFSYRYFLQQLPSLLLVVPFIVICWLIFSVKSLTRRIV